MIARTQIVLALLSALVLPGTPPAQGKAAPESQPVARQEPLSGGKWVSLKVYHEGTSRAAFRACDSSADDRLSIFEARHSLERMGSLEDPEGFQQLDTDKDGHLSWPEFDRHYREVCGRGGSFRLRAIRPFQPPGGARRASAAELAAKYVLQLGDKNQDNTLDRDELQALLVEFNVPADAGKQGFLVLDTDRSASIDQTELQLLVQTLPGLVDLGKQGARPTRDGRLAGAGKTGGAKVTHQELRESLRQLHPGLVRWSRKVFVDADVDKDGVLAGDELGTAPARR